MAVNLFKHTAKSFTRNSRFAIQSAAMSDHYKGIIGKREVVGFGYNGMPVYHDRSDFPLPAIRWKESTPDISVS